MGRLATACVVLLGVPGVIVVSGCDRSGPTRYEVSGQVIFDGMPVEDGVIQFIPQDGQGSSDGASILNGEYRIPKEKGLFPGKYKVGIIAGDGLSTAGDAGATAKPAKRAPPGLTQGVERIPPEWNIRTKQIVEVKADGPNKFDFKIPKRKK